MRITFVLPGISIEPNGGAKVVYEYANRLACRGHSVSVVHPRTWQPMVGAIQSVKARLWPAYIRLRHRDPVPWIPSQQGVRRLLVPDLRPAFLPEADAVIATFFRTAPFVNDLPPSRGRKYYLVQHYEDWAGTKEEVDATWRLPMHKIVISLWLKQIAAELGEERLATHIPNGMDLSAFGVTDLIASRDKRVIMLVSTNAFKGTKDGLAALKAVRKRHPDLQAAGFGTADRSADLPEWFEYTRLPAPEALERIYNAGSVFLQPSHAEGWGLTSTEAMACGCALVTTDNGGSRDFALHEQTALVTQVGDIQGMADCIARLLEDDALRVSLAVAGQEYVQRFTWDRAVDSLENLLTGA